MEVLKVYGKTKSNEKKAEQNQEITKQEVKQNQETVFSKQAVLRSNLFSDYKDIFTVVLSDEKEYTKKELWQKLESFQKREMK